MKAFLMFENSDFAFQQKLPWNEQELTQDLELNTLFNAMSLGDEFLFEIAKKAILSSCYNDLDTILYRQDILKDCQRNSSIVRELYEIAIDAIESKKKHWYGVFTNTPSSILLSSNEILQTLMDLLKQLKNIADEHVDKFKSKGIISFFAMLKKELDDEYFDKVKNHLQELKFNNGILLSAELGKGNKGTNYTLRKQLDKRQGRLQRLFAKKTPVYTFNIHPRDDGGARVLSALRNEGINHVANALAQSTDHILDFFNMLRTELAFYIGCLNLQEQLTLLEEPCSFPYPVASDQCRHSFKGLYDICLALTMKQNIVGSDVTADNKNLVMITGANKGGKSTFLRSIGLSQLMMQCGMFVPADSFSANICDSLFTHYKREEDNTMKSGKLDEELNRMSNIINNITSKSIILFNESFAATNEREGSEIARQIVSALLDKQIKVFFVTHLFDFAHNYYNKKMENTIFLRAERQTDGIRTFKLVEGEPLQTSYGEDLYNKMFITTC
jgi:DNA mismatch repair ATPase MutS